MFETPAAATSCASTDTCRHIRSPPAGRSEDYGDSGTTCWTGASDRALVLLNVHCPVPCRMPSRSRLPSAPDRQRDRAINENYDGDLSLIISQTCSSSASTISHASSGAAPATRRTGTSSEEADEAMEPC